MKRGALKTDPPSSHPSKTRHSWYSIGQSTGTYITVFSRIPQLGGITHMSDKPIQNFEEFWPFYVREHSKKATRIFHFIGTTAGGAAGIAAIALKRPALIPLGLAVGYGAAWFSHFFIENNRPASFRYPLWSFQADWIMWAKMLAGTMDAEVERAMNAEHASNGQNGAGKYDDHATSHTTYAGTNGVN